VPSNVERHRFKVLGNVEADVEAGVEADVEAGVSATVDAEPNTDSNAWVKAASVTGTAKICGSGDIIGGSHNGTWITVASS
jgi:hypothetical protein